VGWFFQKISGILKGIFCNLGSRKAPKKLQEKLPKTPISQPTRQIKQRKKHININKQPGYNEIFCEKKTIKSKKWENINLDKQL
jgi:hypothetical protein